MSDPQQPGLRSTPPAPPDPGPDEAASPPPVAPPLDPPVASGEPLPVTVPPPATTDAADPKPDPDLDLGQQPVAEPVVTEQVDVPACASPEPADAASDVAPEAVAPEAVAPEAVAPEAVAPEATQAGDSRDDDVPSAAVPPEAPAPGRKGRRTRAWLPVSAVGLAVLLLAGSTGLLAWQLRQQSLAEDGRPEAMAAARDAARLLFSYDHQTLEKDFAAGLAVTTGEFREEYSRTTSEVVSPVAEKYDAVVVAEVVETAVVESRPGEVVTLVFLNQGTTSTRVKGQQVDQSRVRMHLVDRDGRWLVEAVEAL